jgi:hypothetical protein
MAKKFMYRFCFLFFSTVIFSCTTTHSINNSNSNKITLETNKTIYINRPRDGRYEGKVYRGSGQTYQELLEIRIENYASKLVLGKAYESKENCINTAKESRADFLIYSTIINWEDRASAWSGIADTVTIKVEIIDLKDDTVIYDAELFGKGKNLTFSSGSPEDLLPGLFEEFTRDIF